MWGDLPHDANAFIIVPGGAYITSSSQENSEQTFFLFTLDKEPPSLVMTSPQVVHLGVTNQLEVTVFLMASAPVYAFRNDTDKLQCQNCEIIEFHDLPGTNQSRFQDDGTMLTMGTVFDIQK